MKLPAMDSLWVARKNEVRLIRNKFREKSKQVERSFKSQMKHLVKNYDRDYEPATEKLEAKLFKNLNCTPAQIRSATFEPVSSLDLLVNQLEADLHSELESVSYEMNDAIRDFMHKEMDDDDRRMKQYAGIYWHYVEDLYHYDQVQYSKWSEILDGQGTSVYPEVRVSWEKLGELVKKTTESIDASQASSSSSSFPSS